MSPTEEVGANNVDCFHCPLWAKAVQEGSVGLTSVRQVISPAFHPQENKMECALSFAATDTGSVHRLPTS